MILYHQNNSYLKFKSSFINFRLSPNDVCLLVFNFTLSSFSLPANCCLQSFNRRYAIQKETIIFSSQLPTQLLLMMQMVVTEFK